MCAGGVKGIAGAQLARERAAPCRLPTSCPCACHSYPRERAGQVSGAGSGARQASSQKREHTHTQLFSSFRNGVLVDCGGIRRLRQPFRSLQGNSCYFFSPLYFLLSPPVSGGRGIEPSD
ncbi:hypothetical protein NFI96_025483 [Prochilodus magdalenae]|nr:hypothetical protein NFI96_025483 [Prochilodus magdalenae]